MSALIEGRSLSVAYGGTRALTGVDVAVTAGEVLAVMGPSGSGKSTLLHVLAGIVAPDAGEVRFDGEAVSGWGERRRAELRLARFGFVFQFGDLVPELTLAENVALPLELTGTRGREARRRALEALDALGIAGEAGRRAAEASGGQVQRAAVARAVVHRPAVVFADEPTGALDTVTGERVLEQLVGLAGEHGSAVVLVTHDARVAAHADREVVLRDGQVAQVPALGTLR
ncbi:MAG TPA: ABC transporter ATP-binding protein [Motilibacteraceae bacterium]|nr:ABC transporter ATP-binding protein [Motilibacteraceae bacterium]